MGKNCVSQTQTHTEVTCFPVPEMFQTGGPQGPWKPQGHVGGPQTRVAPRQGGPGNSRGFCGRSSAAVGSQQFRLTSLWA